MQIFFFSTGVIALLLTAVHGFAIPSNEPGGTISVRAESSKYLAIRGSSQPLPVIPIYPEQHAVGGLIVAALRVFLRNGRAFTGSQTVQNVSPSQVATNLEAEISAAVNTASARPISFRSVPTGPTFHGLMSTVTLSPGVGGNVTDAPMNWRSAAALAGCNNTIAALVQEINSGLTDALSSNLQEGAYNVGVQRSIAGLNVSTNLVTMVISWTDFNPAGQGT